MHRSERAMILDISESNNIIDVVMGKAGTSKSSSLHPLLTERYGEYLRATSTHSLRRDAMTRYPGVKCVTVAGGLFTTTKTTGFYADIKDLNGIKCVVIDEPFQCNVDRLIDFCEEYRGKIKIIICGDDKQMLVPGFGVHYLKAFEEFCKRDYVKVTRLTRTLRTTHNGIEDTKLTAVYDDAYDNVDNLKLSMYDKYEKAFPHITYKELLKIGFNPDDYYVTYTNEAEESLYIDFDVKNNSYLEFIPKGNIASDDNAEFGHYPIACQSQAERLNLNAYLQAKNIGTITRMQGREVPTGHKCYIITPTYCKMTNRAFYTAITRCWSYDSIIFVDYESPKNIILKKFMGEPIKRWGIMATADDVNIEDGYVKTSTIKKYTDNQDTDEFVWRRDCLRVKGQLCYVDAYKDAMPKTRSTAKGLIKKSPELNFNCIDDVYAQIGHFFSQPKVIQNSSKEDNHFQIDLFSAYPHILANGLLPTSGRIYNKMYPDKLNYYEVMTSDVVEEGSIITHQLAALLTKETNTTVQFVFGTDCEIGCKAGEELLKKAYKSKEDKTDTKGVHWGLFNRAYLESVSFDYQNLGERFIVRNPENVYEPLMCAIKSTMLYVMLALKLKLYGRISPDDGFILVDALYLNEDRTEEIKDFFTNGIGFDYFDDIKHYNFDYRIYQAEDWKDKDNYKTLYQSYENLKSRNSVYCKRYYERHKK